MNTLGDIITYLRRIVKTPSGAVLSDALIIDYINRFWLMDVDARMQLFDFKTKYQFQTLVGVVDYNMPLYDVQLETSNPDQSIAPFPVYQGFMDPVLCNGYNLNFYSQRSEFYATTPYFINPLYIVAVGDGTTSDFTLNLPYFPALPGHFDMSGVIYNSNSSVLEDPIFATYFPLQASLINLPVTSFYPRVDINYTSQNGNNVTISDSGIYLSSATDSNLYGLLMESGRPPYGNAPLSSNTYSMTQNTVNYNTGIVNVSFPTPPPAGAQIQAQCYFYQPGFPRNILFWNNTLTLDIPPQTQYLIEIDAYLTPAAFFNSANAIPFAYMAEYIARGAARKILSDTGDMEQFNFYEPLFKEQEMLVWKRSQRQFTSTRTPTIYNGSGRIGNYNSSQGFVG